LYRSLISTKGESTDQVDGRDFRSSRLWSATLLLSRMNGDALQVRMLRGSLLLLAALVFYINCLHSRPDDGSFARKLCRVIFPLTLNHNSTNRIIRSANVDGGEGIPYARGGVMYLRDIKLKPTESTYRFSAEMWVDDDIFNHAIQCLPEDAARFLFNAGIQRHARRIGYIPQRKGKTKRRADREDEELGLQFPEYEGILQEINVEADDGRLAPPERVDVGRAMENLLQQYASDILQKCGNPREKSSVVSYSPLLQYDRQHLSFDDINTLNLGYLFNQVQWRRATPNEWEEGFERMFPPPSYIDPFSTAHFAGCTYYVHYRYFLDLLTPDRVREVREKLKKKIAELAWIPATKSDRLWDYSLGDASWNKGPHKEKGPRILLNRRIVGEVNLDQHVHADLDLLGELDDAAAARRRVDLREEEEEEGSDREPVDAALMRAESLGPSRTMNNDSELGAAAAAVNTRGQNRNDARYERYGVAPPSRAMSIDTECHVP
jgi:hypothetical protein